MPVSNAAAGCEADTEQQLLALFGRTNSTVLFSDGGAYNLTLQWDPAWNNSSAWQQLGCLGDVSTLYIDLARAPVAALPDSWGAQGAFPRLEALQLVNATLGSLPAAWGQNGSFPQLRQLFLYGCHLHGTLPGAWGAPGAFLSLMTLSVCNSSLSGALPAAWASNGSFPALEELYSYRCNLTSTLPEAWGAAAAFRRLRILDVSINSLSGVLPTAWAANHSFPAMSYLFLGNNSLHGSLPASWGSAAAFQRVRRLQLSLNSFAGTLPAAWARSGSWPALYELGLDHNKLSGGLESCGWGAPGAFPSLQILWLGTNALNGSVPINWGSNGSFANLTGLHLNSNSLSGQLPAWANGSFRSLQILQLYENVLEGTLPASWSTSFPLLTNLLAHNNSLSGTLPSAWGSGFPRLGVLSLSGNKLEGTLPGAWAGSGSMRRLPRLSVLALFDNRLRGPLPSAWGAPGAFTQLLYIDIGVNEIDGPLPSSWGTLGALPKLAFIFGSNNRLSGAIPPAWTSRDALLSLIWLDLGRNALEGQPPAFSNQQLGILNLAGNSLSGDCSAFWTASSTLGVVDISSNRITGTLPRQPAFSQALQALNVDNTSLSGIIPVEWLGAGGLLTRIAFKGKSLWDSSAGTAAWRREVCQSPGLYMADAARQSILQSGVVAMQFTNLVQGGGLTGAAAAHLALYVNGVPILGDLLAGRPTEAQSLSSICQVIDANRMIAVAWGVFLAVATMLMLAYVFAMRLGGCAGIPFMQCSFLKPLGTFGKRGSDLVSVLVYSYDVAKDIIVLGKVWDFKKWYGYTLLGILLCHHVYRGCVMSLFFTRHYSAAAPKDWLLRLMRCAFALVSSPVMVLFTVFMDVCTYLASIVGMQSPAALEVDSYCDMRSLVMGVLQSLPMAIMTTFIFHSGNSPFYGEYFSVDNAVIILVGSFASVLVGLCRVLWLSYSEKRGLARTFLAVFTGHGLHRPGCAASGWRACLPSCSPACLAAVSGRRRGSSVQSTECKSVALPGSGDDAVKADDASVDVPGQQDSIKPAPV